MPVPRRAISPTTRRFPAGRTTSSSRRLLLFHLPQRVSVLARLWDAVRPGGHLVVQDYDLDPVDVVPAVASVTETNRLLVRTFEALGCDVRAGVRLPQLFAEAGVGPRTAPTSPAGWSRSAPGTRFSSRRCSASSRPRRRTGSARAALRETLAALRRDAAGMPDRALFWPLMVGAWRRKPA